MANNVALARRNGQLAFLPKVSRREVQHMTARALSARKSAMKLREKSEEVVGEMVASLEVGLASFVTGLLNGRYKSEGGLTIANVPLGLAGTLVSHLSGFLLVGNEAAIHLHNLGDGFGGAYMTQQGVKQGLRLSGRMNGSTATSPPSSEGESVMDFLKGVMPSGVDDDDADIAGDDDNGHD